MYCTVLSISFMYVFSISFYSMQYALCYRTLQYPLKILKHSANSWSYSHGDLM